MGALIQMGRVLERDSYLIFLDVKTIQAKTKSKRGLKRTSQKLILAKIPNKSPFIRRKWWCAYSMGRLFNNFSYRVSAY